MTRHRKKRNSQILKISYYNSIAESPNGKLVEVSVVTDPEEIKRLPKNLPSYTASDLEHITDRIKHATAESIARSKERREKRKEEKPEEKTNQHTI